MSRRQVTRGRQSSCEVCDTDAAFLRSTRPGYEALRPRLRIVDLFAGCGGLTLGVAEAARRLALGLDVRLAVDSDADAVRVYRANLPHADVRHAKVEELFDGDLSAPLTRTEAELRERTGEVDVLIGGPPCQGHSDLNNHTRRMDPRNDLYARMARAAEVLEPTVVLIENVPTVTHDTERVVATTVERLKASGYSAAEGVIDISRLGAPQLRRRHVVLASRDHGVVVDEILAGVAQRCGEHPVRSVRWAIGDLVTRKPMTLFDSASTLSATNSKRIAWLFEHRRYDLPNSERPECHRSDHSYMSMYGRLRWDSPAQTVTTGFGSMGQGRYVHPSRRRTITPHEAARIQMLPDFWDFSMVAWKGSLARLIGNAVPPVLATSVLVPTLRSLGFGAVTNYPPSAIPQPADVAGARRRRIPPGARRLAVPQPPSQATSARMRTVRQTGTAAELAIRAEIDRLGLEYTTDAQLTGTKSRADLLFGASGVVVLVDGCFWHGCPTHGTSPSANADWWRAKLDTNRIRDRNTERRLHRDGWVVLRFWEHDDPTQVAQQIAETVGARTRALANGESSASVRRHASR